MKDFFKMMFACLVALILAGVAMMFFCLVLIGIFAAAAGGGARPVVHDGSIMVVDLSVNIADAPPSGGSEEFIAQMLGSGGPQRLQLRKVVASIDAAATDNRIRGMFLQGAFAPVDLGSGYAALLEVRAAIERFRDTGKPVIAYLVGPSTRDYLVASAASRIVINPLGMIAAPGLSAEVLYLGGTFEKFGIGVQVAKAGKYKSAGEAFTQREMSPAEREQMTALLADVWAEFIQPVSISRGIDREELQALIDTEGVITAERALESGLVDEIKDFPDLLMELKEMTGRDADDRTFTQVALPTYIAERFPPNAGAGSKDRIAVVYAEGTIVDGEGGPGNVGGDRLARELREIRRDEKVKAVVLRVNSPGGSAIASEVIRRELVLLHEDKPLVVSMGSVAASGGYWIATDCDHIFAQPNTITGSIGVIAILPNLQGVAQKIELNVETINTGRNADLFSIVKPRSLEAMAVIQKLVDETYVKFIDRVVAGRDMDREAVEAVAGGRVWSGEDALAHGLVDELGGLKQAIAHAAGLAGIEDYTVIDHPPARTFLEQVLEKLENTANPVASRGPAAGLRNLIVTGLRRLEALNDPTGVYAIMPVSVEIH
ncbi:MAG: signal peptide peptidase SppA [Opitutaceae bacterium]